MREDLARVRELTMRLIARLERDVIAAPGAPLAPEQWDAQLWGARENSVSVLSTLSQLLIKLLPVELSLCDAPEEAGGATPPEAQRVLTAEDLDLLEHFLARHRPAFSALSDSPASPATPPSSTSFSSSEQ